MEPHKDVEIALDDLIRDPVLPPRIVDDHGLERLSRSLTESGMAQPLVVRPDPAAPAEARRYLIVLGYRRFLAAGRIGWSTVRAIVRDDLDDQGVVQMAFDADKTTENRTALEDCWYYASMCATGMTQAALAEREGVSEGKASMYVRTGNGLTPERIAEADLVPEDLAGLGITKLAAIASGPEEEVVSRIEAAVQPVSNEEGSKPAFEWREGREGQTRVILRTTHPADWAKEERLRFIENVGPLLAAARSVEGLEDPIVGEVRSRLEEVHRVALIEAREAHSEEIVRLLEVNTRLLLSLDGRRPVRPEVYGEPEGSGLLLRLLRRPLQRALRWFRPGSTVEEGGSTVEDAQRETDPQIRIRFEEEQVA